MLKCGLEIVAFECDKWRVKVLNDKTLAFQLFAYLVKCFKKIDMREWIIIMLRVNLIIIVLIWGMWSSRNDKIEIFEIFYVLELVKVLRYNFEEIKEMFYYYEINEKKSNTWLKNKIKLRKLWEKEIEKKINCFIIKW